MTVTETIRVLPRTPSTEERRGGSAPSACLPARPSHNLYALFVAKATPGNPSLDRVDLRPPNPCQNGGA